MLKVTETRNSVFRVSMDREEFAAIAVGALAAQGVTADPAALDVKTANAAGSVFNYGESFVEVTVSEVIDHTPPAA